MSNAHKNAIKNTWKLWSIFHHELKIIYEAIISMKEENKAETQQLKSKMARNRKKWNMKIQERRKQITEDETGGNSMKKIHYGTHVRNQRRRTQTEVFLKY